MNNHTLLKGFAILASLFLGAAAYAAGQTGSSKFQELDENQDGKLSAVEASNDSELSSVWSKVDKDGNGAIDRAEFSAFESMEMDQKYEQPGATTPGAETP